MIVGFFRCNCAKFTFSFFYIDTVLIKRNPSTSYVYSKANDTPNYYNHVSFLSNRSSCHQRSEGQRSEGGTFIYSGSDDEKSWYRSDGRYGLGRWLLVRCQHQSGEDQYRNDDNGDQPCSWRCSKWWCWTGGLGFLLCWIEWEGL